MAGLAKGGVRNLSFGHLSGALACCLSLIIYLTHKQLCYNYRICFSIVQVFGLRMRMVMNDNLEKEAQSAEATIPAEEVKAPEEN